tara:strand:- start:2762 stop:2959 length:198 start_codon:yes stop_codon:yes gene_type:complete
MINIVELERANLISAKISDKISKDEVEKVHTLIYKIIETGKKVDFYFELEDFKSYSKWHYLYIRY